VDKNRDYAQVLEERDGAGTLAVSYVYGDDLISQERSGAVSYYQYDGLGSTRALTDDFGDATDTYDFEAFGTLLNSTGTTENNYLFAGEQYDPNARFYYLRARWMNPETGRFLTVDPFVGRIQDPVTLHKYLYASANPVMFVDPSGEFIALYMINSLIDIIKKAGESAIVGGTGAAALTTADAVMIATSLAIATTIAINCYLAATNNSSSSKGFTGGNSKTVANIKTKTGQVRVDIEYPTGKSTGNVHINIKSPKTKIYLNSVDDLQNLPKSLRKNAEIKRAVERAFEQLNKFVR
jgi:RHS repeat-associated protein